MHKKSYKTFVGIRIIQYLNCIYRGNDGLNYLPETKAEEEAMSRNVVSITLTLPEISHILGLIQSNESEGNYYGNRDEYWLRSNRIKAKLLGPPEKQKEKLGLGSPNM